MTVAITALPTPPSSTDPVNFDARADAFLAALPSTVTQMNAQNTENNSINSQAVASATSAASSAAAATANGAAQVTLAANQVTLATAQVALATNQATTAAGHAATALTHATTSAVNAGAVLWVSGTTYAIGDARYSAVTGQTYRRLTAGAGTIDPSSDATNWKPILLDVQTNLPTIRPSLNLDFANSKTIDPRIGFTRATTATYCDGNTTAKAEENYFVYSQDFSNTNWTSNSETVVTVNSTVAPDLTSTANLVSATTTSSYHGVRRAYYMRVGVPITVSIYAKPGAYSKLVMSDASHGTYTANFDLTLGTVISSQGCSAAITRDPVTGWCRCSLVHNTATSLFRVINFMGYPNSGATLDNYGAQYTGDGTSGVYLWGAQLEERAFLTAYTPTTTSLITNYIPTLLTAIANQPRINHDPVTGECLGLLVEASATNLLTYSQDFSNAAWTKLNGSVGEASTISPDGTLTARKIIPSNGTASATTNIIQQVTKAASVEIWTASVYAKASGSAVGIRLYVHGTSTSDQAVVAFDLVNATIGTPTVSGSFTVTPTMEIKNVGNGWYRVSMTFTTNTDTTVGYSLAPLATSGGSFTGDGVQGILVWGAQLEAQRMATSYIPTTSATVTRNSDTALISGNNFTSFYNQAEGTIFVEANYNKSSAENLANRFMYEVGTHSFYRLMGYNDGTIGANFRVIESSVTQAALGPAGVADNSFKKVAHAYKTNDFGASLNGSVAVLDSSGKPPQSSILGIGSTISGTAQLSGHIKKLTYYPVRLSNTTLQAMTAQ